MGVSTHTSHVLKGVPKGDRFMEGHGLDSLCSPGILPQLTVTSLLSTEVGPLSYVQLSGGRLHRVALLDWVLVIRNFQSLFGNGSDSKKNENFFGVLAVATTDLHRAVQGNCTNLKAPGGLDLDPPPGPGQCVITLRQDFLHVALPDSEVWLSGLYLRLRGLPRNPSAAVNMRGRGLYMTNMTFAGDKQLQRGLLVMERSRVFISGAYKDSSYGRS